ncbi:hypothetical protein [Lacisediminihabitans sp. H27-G8]|uniref:hypothetical protein n=1 Tax=Lacisediminihabitans sp. H27-G8 TaxID=3111909 RepID=UPI0038FC9148
MPKAEWAKIRSFVLDAVAGSSIGTSLDSDRALVITAPFVRWAVLKQGLPQEASAIFTTRAIEQYCLWRIEKDSLTEGSVASYRAVLRRVSDRIAPETNPEPTRAYSRRRIMDPYVRSELDKFRAWANGQSNDLQTRRAKLLLSACAGAGLNPGELGTIRPIDVDISESGITISVQGAHPRKVTLLAEWESMFLDGIAVADPMTFVWGETATRTKDRNYIASFTHRCVGVAPLPTRLRGSWIVTLLDRRVHIATILEAAGFTHFDNLHQYLPFLTKEGSHEARSQLRGESAK